MLIIFWSETSHSSPSFHPGEWLFWRVPYRW